MNKFQDEVNIHWKSLQPGCPISFAHSHTGLKQHEATLFRLLPPQHFTKCSFLGKLFLWAYLDSSTFFHFFRLVFLSLREQSSWVWHHNTEFWSEHEIRCVVQDQMLNSLSLRVSAYSLTESEKQLKNNGLPFGRKDETDWDTEQRGAFVDMSLVFPASGLCVWSCSLLSSESVFGCFALSAFLTVPPSSLRAGRSPSAGHTLVSLMFNCTTCLAKLNQAKIAIEQYQITINQG